MQQFLESVRRDGSRMAQVIGRSDLTLAVPSCPGWAIANLAAHMGYIHRWVVAAVATCDRPHNEDIEASPEGADAAELGQWLQQGVDTLVTTLAGLRPEAPTWHPFLAPQTVELWPRRQAQETMVHRWDAEIAVGDLTPLDPVVAADGILEYFQIIVPRVASRDGRRAPQGVLRIECPDVGMICTVSAAATVDVELGDGVVATPDATLTGRAEDVLLALWRRHTLPGEHPGLAAEWLAFGGN